MVLGIIGKKHAGKDTFASFVKKWAPDARIESFAARLKDVCGEVFPISKECYVKPLLKETPFDRSIEIDHYLPKLSDLLALDLKPLGRVAENARQVLQFVGTEYVRAIQDDYWTSYLLKKIEAENDREQRLVLVPDTRFENEAKAIRSFGDGMLLKVVRTSQVAVDGHASEMEQEKIKCPTLYLNDNEFLLSEAIACLMTINPYRAFDLIERSSDDWRKRSKTAPLKDQPSDWSQMGGAVERFFKA